jgi:hypothetical protein
MHIETAQGIPLDTTAGGDRDTTTRAALDAMIAAEAG